jgi:signal transduction histidine kinase
MKIRTRLTLQFMLLTACIFIAALVFIYEQFKYHVENEFFTLLEGKARMTAHMVLRHEDELKPIDVNVGNPADRLPDAGNILILDPKMQLVFALNTVGQLPTQDQLVMYRKGGTCRMQHNGFAIFATNIISSSGGNYLVISEDRPDFSKLYQLQNILLVTLLLVVLAVAYGGWFYAGQALYPVSHIVHEVEHILPTDLSKRIKNEHQKDELSHLAATFNRLLDRIEYAFYMQKGFISNVSHELRNPLAAMHAQLQVAQNKAGAHPEYSALLLSLQEYVQNMTDTADKLLQLARIHSQENKIEMEPIRPDELLYQTRAALIKNHPEYTVKIQIEHLPEDEQLMFVQGNEALLRTALLNLFENGCKFSPDKTVVASIRLQAEDQLVISVSNAGAPIPPDELERIFEPFYRSTQHTRQKGSGVGLSLVKSIVKLHQIDLQVQSDDQHGTTFTLLFAKNDAYEPETSHLPQQTPKRATTASRLNNITRFFYTLIIATLVWSGCTPTSEESLESQNAVRVVQEWNKLLLDLDQNTEGYRPPVSARMFAYMGIAAWETGLPLYKNAVSMTKEFGGFAPPAWDPAQKFIPAVALNSAYATMTDYFFSTTEMTAKQRHLALAETFTRQFHEQYTDEEMMASVLYGRSVAQAVCAWSATDTIGHLAHLFNYDRNFHLPVQPGIWQPDTTENYPALLPHWGKARTFFMHVSDIGIPAVKPEFSEDKGSLFFAQAMEVYAISQPLSPEKQWIANFWSDDFPGVSFTTAARWISIAHQAVDQQPLSLKSVLGLYLKLGIALNDAAVTCWHSKYLYNFERPVAYIRRNIASDWSPLHDAPPFPSYPSGHATFGYAACGVLEQVFGEQFEMTDNSHIHRKKLLGMPRQFSSFKSMAYENALSRMYIGVHYRMDCEEGIRLGTLVGNRIQQLTLFNETVMSEE